MKGEHHNTRTDVNEVRRKTSLTHGTLGSSTAEEEEEEEEQVDKEEEQEDKEEDKEEEQEDKEEEQEEEEDDDDVCLCCRCLAGRTAGSGWTGSCPGPPSSPAQ